MIICSKCVNSSFNNFSKYYRKISGSITRFHIRKNKSYIDNKFEVCRHHLWQFVYSWFMKSLCFAATRMSEFMDRSAQPCTDFYQYACGNWLASSLIPEGMSEVNIYTNMKSNVKATLRSKSFLTVKEKVGFYLYFMCLAILTRILIEVKKYHISKCKGSYFL